MYRCLIALVAFFSLGLPAQSAVVHYEYYGNQMHGLEDAEGRTLRGLRMRLAIDLSRVGDGSLANKTLYFPDPASVFASRSDFLASTGYVLHINHIYFPNDMFNEFSVTFDEDENIVAWSLAVLADCSPQDCWLFVNSETGREIVSLFSLGKNYGGWYTQQKWYHFASSTLGRWEKAAPIPLPAPALLLLSALAGLAGLRRRAFPALHPRPAPA